MAIRVASSCSSSAISNPDTRSLRLFQLRFWWPAGVTELFLDETTDELEVERDNRWRRRRSLVVACELSFAPSEVPEEGDNLLRLGLEDRRR